MTIEEHPSYLHARVVGERTPANALRFLEEVYAACVQANQSAALLEVDFSGPSLDTARIFEVITRRVAEGSRLRKIAYVQRSAPDPAMPYFAELVARNRGVNVRLFQTVDAAAKWLSDEAE